MHFDHAATDGLDIQHAGVAAQVTRDPFAAIAFDLGLAIGMPASGYYEWKTTPEGKQPYYFTRITPVMLCSATANAAANSSFFIEPIPLLAAAEVATCQLRIRSPRISSFRRYSDLVVVVAVAK
jgi:hypothetical protein